MKYILRWLIRALFNLVARVEVTGYEHLPKDGSFVIATNHLGIVDAPIALHPDDTMLWTVVYPERTVDIDLEAGSWFASGGHSLGVLHTPGHAPGCCCFHDAESGAVFSGDTLFCGGPGATGRSYSDQPTILASIREQLLTLPPETVVHTGHGDSTTIGAETPIIEELIRSEAN